MATYKEAQERYRKLHGKTVETCWIAHVLAENGKTSRIAPNRIGKERRNPCPDKYWKSLESVLKELKML
ncbi:MAG TPA: hypothetical protein VJ044_19115 [Candidatus Hodarchaeales archaeon]|nr:hypothetical protein [Candidatus Hodarchaeales archaeon]